MITPHSDDSMITGSNAAFHRVVDSMEAMLARCPQIDHRLEHRFTPGLYIRQITMPAGSIYTSKIHKTEHPFTMLTGLCSVLQEDGTWLHMKAPWFGITKPGTRRVLAIHEETIWLTFHPTEETDLDKIEEQVIEKHDFMESLKKGELPWLG